VSWVPVAAWLFAAAFATAVLGYLGWQVARKARRLQAGMDDLTALATQLTAVQHDLVTARTRIVQAQRRAAGG